MVLETAKEAIYSDFADRLNAICDEKGLPDRGRPQLLGKMAGVGYKGAEKWIKGLSMPDVPHGTALAIGLDVYFEYLMTGRGPKYMETKSQLKAAESAGEYRIADIVSIAETAMNKAGVPADDKLRKQPLFGEFLELIGQWYHDDPDFDRSKLSEMIRFFNAR